MTKATLSLLFIVLTQSCASTSSGSFWTNFHKNDLTKKIIAQDAYGGHKSLYWHSSTPNAFEPSKLISFANKNNWTIADTLRFKGEEVLNWKFNGKSLFPLSSTGFDPTDTIYNSQFDFFPLDIKGDITIYKFKTGWTLVDPGTAKTTDALGYVLLNNDKTEMSVYYLWGD